MTDHTGREPASDLPTALAEAGVPSGDAVRAFHDTFTACADGTPVHEARTRSHNAAVAVDLDAIGRVWLARRLEAMKDEYGCVHAPMIGHEDLFLNAQELLDLLAPEAP